VKEMQILMFGLISTVAGALVAPAPILASTDTSADNRAIGDEGDGSNWLSNGRTYSEQHFSPLTSINERNVGRLGLAWYLDLPHEGTLQATPLAVDGLLFFTGTVGRTYAVDATTGRMLWEFAPELVSHVPRRRAISLISNRGVAYWHGNVYVGTIDGRLVALNGKTGRVVWSTQTFDEGDDLKRITGAPRAFNGKIIIGHAGELTKRGYVTAYDAESGKKLWRFHTIPGDPDKGFESDAMAIAAKTWSGEWWKTGGNGTVWDSIVYDPQFNRIYLGTANRTQFDARRRAPGSGNSLFTASIVALEADTGKYVWHYQTTPSEIWDYDATQQIVLADLTIRGRPRQVLMQAPKNGFFYVIDRADGKLISAEKITKVSWAERIDPKSGRPVESHNARNQEGAATIWPGPNGAHSWQAMSFNPKLGMVYIPTMEQGWRLGDPWGAGVASLMAWDPVAQKRRWSVRYRNSFWNGGMLSTAGGLVFQGTGRGYLASYSAVTGKKLWNFYAGLGIVAPPISYMAGDVQYVSVLIGYGGGINFNRACDYGWHYGEQPRRLLTFAVGMHKPLPPGKPPRFSVNAVDDPSLIIDKRQAAEGAAIYGACGSCHGPNLKDIGGFAPDLRESVLATRWDAFEAVVHEGALLDFGMPKFDDLSEEEVRALYMYIRLVARTEAIVESRVGKKRLH
jgi:quinohemoprotein ethanol dehydrogenase